MKTKIALIVSILLVIMAYIFIIRPLMQFGDGVVEDSRRHFFGVKILFTKMAFQGIAKGKRDMISRRWYGVKDHRYKLVFKAEVASKEITPGASYYLSYGSFTDKGFIQDSMIEIEVPESIFSNVREGYIVSKKSNDSRLFINNKPFPYLSDRETELIVTD